MENQSKPLVKEKVKLRSSKLLEVDCPNCGSLVNPKNININNSMGKCDSCQEVFSFEEDHFFFNDRPGRPEMIMPEGTDVLTLSESLDIRINWFKSYSKGGLGFLTFFTFMWNAIVGFFAFNMIASGAAGALIGLSMHLVVGLGLAYWLGSIFLNKTDIIISKDKIRITAGPLRNPFKPDKIIDVTDLKQFYVNRYVSSTTNGQPNHAYALYAISTNNTKQEIIKGMNKETQLYLEQEIERYLKIKDSHVGGMISE